MDLLVSFRFNACWIYILQAYASNILRMIFPRFDRFFIVSFLSSCIGSAYKRRVPLFNERVYLKV